MKINKYICLIPHKLDNVILNPGQEIDGSERKNDLVIFHHTGWYSVDKKDFVKKL